MAKARFSFLSLLVIVLMLMTLMLVVSMLRFNLEASAEGSPATGITDIAFSDANNGVAVGYYGLILHTSDGGLNWQTIDWINSGKEGYGGRVCLVNSMIGYISMSGPLLKTEDGGFTWEIIGNVPATNDLYFLDELKGWSCGGQYKKLYYTEDGGLNWVLKILTVPLLNGVEIMQIQYLDSLHGKMVGTDGVWYTEDGGVTWGYTSIPSSGLPQTFSFIDVNRGWVTTNFGEFYHTEDGGVTWNLQNYQQQSCIMQIDFINETHGYAVSTKGELWSTTDGGNAYSISREFDNDWRSMYVDHSNGNVYTVGGSWRTGFGRTNSLLAVVEKQIFTTEGMIHSQLGTEVQLAPTMNRSVNQNGTDYTIMMQADSTLTSFDYNSTTDTFSFSVFGPDGYNGTCKVTIPKAITVAVPQVYFDGSVVVTSIVDTGTAYLITLEYHHSNHDIIISFALVGDINGDGIVELIDFFYMALAFGSTSGSPNWNEKCDLHSDGIIDLMDFYVLSLHFGEHR